MAYTRGDFARAVLKELDAPETKRTMRALLAWQQAEGNAGRYNPLNCTQWLPGSTDFNSVGVKNYAGFQDGVDATARTLLYGMKHNPSYRYGPIVTGLRKNRWASVVLAAVEVSAWGTGGLAAKCLSLIKSHFVQYSHVNIAQ